jgi:hypothetical protein
LNEIILSAVTSAIGIEFPPDELMTVSPLPVNK